MQFLVSLCLGGRSWGFGMSGVGLIYDLRAIDKLEERIAAIAGFDRRKLLDVIGSTVESQTRRRIEEDKTDPEGVAWPKWSEKYAKTRRANQRMLDGEGDLLDSIGYVPDAEQVEIGVGVETGSNLIYAATHQMGDDSRNIPARAYLGLSLDDESELEKVVDDFISRAMNH